MAKCTISPADFINNKNFDVPDDEYRCAIREIQTKLEVLDDEFQHRQTQSISSIKSRAKVLPASRKKLRRRDLPFTEEVLSEFGRCRRNRVICPFISDIYTIANLITSQDDITVL